MSHDNYGHRAGYADGVLDCAYILRGLAVKRLGTTEAGICLALACKMEGIAAGFAPGLVNHERALRRDCDHELALAIAEIKQLQSDLADTEASWKQDCEVARADALDRDHEIALLMESRASHHVLCDAMHGGACDCAAVLDHEHELALALDMLRTVQDNYRSASSEFMGSILRLCGGVLALKGELVGTLHEYAEALNLLRDMEWRSLEPFGECGCPGCGRDEDVGHDTDCRVAAIIGRKA